MKKALVGLFSIGFATAVYASCTTQTIIIGGKMTTCTTCCSFGNCTTTCI